MSQIPPYQMSTPPGGPAPKQSNNKIWLWVVLGMAGMCVVCGVVGAAVLLPAFAKARSTARSTITLSRVKQISLATVMYAGDFDDKIPPFTSAKDATLKLEAYYKSPSLTKAAEGYTWNIGLSGKKISGFTSPSDVWLVHSTEIDPTKKFSIGFIDGHAARFQQEAMNSVIEKSSGIEKNYKAK